MIDVIAPGTSVVTVLIGRVHNASDATNTVPVPKPPDAVRVSLNDRASMVPFVTSAVAGVVAGTAAAPYIVV